MQVEKVEVDAKTTRRRGPRLQSTCEGESLDGFVLYTLIKI